MASNKLARAIISSRMSEKEFSELSGFTVTYIRAVADGKLPPSPSFKKKITEILKIDAEVVFPPESEQNKKPSW